jgi:hypothetical protein
MLLLATKAITTLAFFGYAREGAVVIPVFAMLLGLLVTRGLPDLAGFPKRTSAYPAARRWVWASCLLALGLIAIEGARWVSEPVFILDGHEIGAGDPFPGMEYAERRLQIK